MLVSIRSHATLWLASSGIECEVFFCECQIMGCVGYLDRAADQFAIFSNAESSCCKHKPLLVSNDNASVSRGLQIVRCVLRTLHFTWWSWQSRRKFLKMQSAEPTQLKLMYPNFSYQRSITHLFLWIACHSVSRTRSSVGFCAKYQRLPPSDHLLQAMASYRFEKELYNLGYPKYLPCRLRMISLNRNALRTICGPIL